jgi:gas vesicle protein
LVQKDGTGYDYFDDPTDPLRHYELQLPKLAQEEVEQYSQQLQAKRLIVLSCLDEEVATSAAYSLIYQQTFSALEKRVLRTDNIKNRDRDDLSIELLMEPYAFGNQGRDTLIVTMPSDVDNINFYGSLLSGRLSAKQIEERLREFNRLIVCLVNSTRLRERLISEQHHENFSFKLIDIDYLQPLLRHHIRDEQKAKELIEELRQQRNNGLWEENETDFYEHIKALIAENALIKEITRRNQRQQSSEQGYTQYIEEEIEKIKAAFQDDKTLECAVLYVATFFEQLNTTDFSKVVKCLLAGKTRPTTTEKITKKGKIKSIQGEDESLVEVWTAQRDKILNDYYITVVTLTDSSRVLDFCFPYLRRILRRYLEREQPYYLEEQFERLQKYGLLFDDSQKISDCVVSIAVDMASSNSETYGEQWLFEWVVALLGNIDREAQGGVLEEILRDLFQQMKHEQKQRVFSRMANLTREMMQHSHLHQTIKKFLNKLIDLRFHTEVLEIVRSMRFIPNFEQLYWIKQLLERGGEETRRKTSLFLYNYIKYSGSRFNDVIKQLYDWMQQPNKNPQSSVYMFPLFIDFLVDSTVAFNQSQYGQPKNHLVLTALIEENIESQTFAKLLFHPDNLKLLLRKSEIDSLIRGLVAKWNLTLRAGGNYAGVPERLLEQLLLHLAYSLDKELRQHKISNQRDLEKLLADANNQSIALIKREVADIIGVLIAEWFVIVHGLEDSQQNEKGVRFFEQFLQQIINAVPARKKELTTELTECWKKMAALIRDVINNIKEEQKVQREKERAKLIKSLALKEKQIKKLRIKFKLLSKAY